MFQRLLLAVDDSSSSEIAVDFVTAFAQQHVASVHVLHVNEYLVSGRGVTLLRDNEAVHLLTSAVTQLREAGITASGSSEIASYRDVPQRICEAAREYGADAIVLGSRRGTRLSRIFSAHVRERTTRLTELPVLTAPSPLNVSSRSQLETIDFATELDHIAQLLARAKQHGGR